jgi:shikimate dehydrogenase
MIKKCYVIGLPVSQSLSPVMHNAAYHALNIHDQYEYSAREVPESELAAEVQRLRDPSICGVSVTIPHKVNIMTYLDEIDIISRSIGAVNTIYKENGKLCGTNTDWKGVLLPLKNKATLSDKKVALYGAGGAARAACFALVEEGALVTIINRTQENGDKLAKDFNCNSKNILNVDSLEAFDIIVNSIPYTSNSEFLPVNPRHFLHNHIFFDMVYRPYKTSLIAAAEKSGAVIIPGIEMLLYQGIEQFEIFTGLEAPVEVMREALLEAINEN